MKGIDTSFHDSSRYIYKVLGCVTIKNKENPDGLLLKEEYLREAHTYGNMSQTLAHDEYFVLGDNREASSDSRRWGALKEEFIVGKVFVRAYPFQNAEVFK